MRNVTVSKSYSGIPMPVVYGVDIKVDKLNPIFIDENGYALNDSKISYTINPAEYKAFTAYVNILRNGEIIAYMPAELQGNGTAAIAKGFQFDLDSKIEVEVVLNAGTGVEIRSDKVPLPVGMFKMVAYDDPQKSMVGAVTDGTSKLRLQLTAKSNQEAFANSLWKIVDPQILEPLPPSEQGTFLNGENPVDSLPVIFNSEGVAEAIYRAPESFVRWSTGEADNDKTRPTRVVQPTVDSMNYLRTLKDPFPSIRVKRPPVVLVHGLWGNPKVWDIFVEKFNDKSLYEIYRVNYSENGQVSSIVNNVAKLVDSIDDAIGKAGEQLFAANKVDIVAHSLGGLLTREYCSQDIADCQDKIRRFITIATPHRGSELADLLLVFRDDIDNFPATPLCRKNVANFISGDKIQLFKYISFGISSGEPHPIGPSRNIEDPDDAGSAIDDLATGTLPTAIVPSQTEEGPWNAYADLSSILNSHTIIGEADPGSVVYTFTTWGLWQFVLPPCGFTPENVFGSASDMIVRTVSQQGGLADGNSTHVYMTDHASVRNSTITIVKIQELLDSSLSSGLFSK
jgi:pimeloyl-ACP methyl ester carboxylesterase